MLALAAGKLHNNFGTLRKYFTKPRKRRHGGQCTWYIAGGIIERATLVPYRFLILLQRQVSYLSRVRSISLPSVRPRMRNLEKVLACASLGWGTEGVSQTLTLLPSSSEQAQLVDLGLH